MAGVFAGLQDASVRSKSQPNSSTLARGGFRGFADRRLSMVSSTHDAEQGVGAGCIGGGSDGMHSAVRSTRTIRDPRQAPADGPKMHNREDVRGRGWQRKGDPALFRNAGNGGLLFRVLDFLGIPNLDHETIEKDRVP